MGALTRRRFRSSGYSSGPSGGGIGGGVIAAVVDIVIIVFLFMLWYEYRKAKRLQIQKGTPISKGKIFKDAALIAVTLGLASCYCAEACDLGDSGNSGGGGGGNAQAAPQPQMSGAGGFVPQPQPSYQPQNMDWTPVQSEAQDPIQAPPIDDS